MFDLPIHPVTGLRALGIGKRGPIWPQLGAAETEDNGDAAEPTAAEEDTTPQETEKDSAPTFQPITSQEDLNKILGRRVAQERAKYSGFDDLKAKAAKYDELEEAKKTAEQRLTERLQAIEQENTTLKLDKLRASVAEEKGAEFGPRVVKLLAKRLSGKTREELEADADDLLDDYRESIPKPEPKVPLSQKPKESLRGGGRPDEEPEETDPRKLAAKIPR
ncbi:hypothetical protein ACIBQ0_17200 [Nocardia nova]|uniref:hypothetical protein n=1 Tax=Nocardia nova TaxID=37330 RepID=UPI0037AC816A